jgi:hypothetical protein
MEQYILGCELDVVGCCNNEVDFAFICLVRFNFEKAISRPSTRSWFKVVVGIKWFNVFVSFGCDLEDNSTRNLANNWENST